MTISLKEKLIESVKSFIQLNLLFLMLAVYILLIDLGCERVINSPSLTEYLSGDLKESLPRFIALILGSLPVLFLAMNKKYKTKLRQKEAELIKLKESITPND